MHGVLGLLLRVAHTRSGKLGIEVHLYDLST